MRSWVDYGIEGAIQEMSEHSQEAPQRTAQRHNTIPPNPQPANYGLNNQYLPQNYADTPNIRWYRPDYTLNNILCQHSNTPLRLHTKP